MAGFQSHLANLMATGKLKHSPGKAAFGKASFKKKLAAKPPAKQPPGTNPKRMMKPMTARSAITSAMQEIGGGTPTEAPDSPGSNQATRAAGPHKASKNGHPDNFIKSAIKRPGALTKAVGGKPSKNMGKVRQLAKSGTPLQKKEANFYTNVLKPTSVSLALKD